MTPKVGMTVLYKQSSAEKPTNGVHVHPAIVTRVHTDRCVNLCVFFDAVGPVAKTSVELGNIDGVHTAWNWADPTLRALEG